MYPICQRHRIIMAEPFEDNTMEQSPYNNPEMPPISVNEPHMALIFLLDTSASMTRDPFEEMSGRPIDQLNAGLKRFKEQACMDDATKRILDVAIIRFDRDYQVVQEFRPVEDMMVADLSADGGSTIYSPAIRKALEMVDARIKLYREYCEPYKPWIVFITDGQPHDDITDIAREINDRMEKGKVSFRSLAVGQFDRKKLHALSPNVMELERKADFTDFFDWVNKSMAHVSRSSPGDKPQSARLEGNVKIDLQDTSWMN